MLRPILRLVVLLSICTPCVVSRCAYAQSSIPESTEPITKLIQAHKNVLDRMNALETHDEAVSLSDARMGPILTEGWQLAGNWASAWFDQHPRPSANDLNKLFVDFIPPLSNPEVYDPAVPDLYAMEGSATQIGTNVYLVTATYETYHGTATSTFFIIGKGSNDRFRVKWSIKPLAAKHYHLKDQIGLWAFVDSCAYYCGPLVVQQVLALPPSETGSPRFAIDAVQATNGNTLMKQFSVWEWDSGRAAPLLIRPYKDYIDDKRTLAITGDQISIPTKETTRSFSSYGCCDEPRGVWTIGIEPRNIKDLGHRFVQPQIAWADHLIAASRGTSQVAASLAAPSVVKYLKHAEFDANIVDECHVLTSGRTGAFEISFGEGTKLWLAYRLRGGQPYFTSIRME